MPHRDMVQSTGTRSAAYGELFLLRYGVICWLTSIKSVHIERINATFQNKVG